MVNYVYYYYYLYYVILSFVIGDDEINFCKKLQHSVVHTISTGNNTPCKARPRPLLAGTKKVVESKKTWFNLEELGVV